MFHLQSFYCTYFILRLSETSLHACTLKWDFNKPSWNLSEKTTYFGIVNSHPEFNCMLSCWNIRVKFKVHKGHYIQNTSNQYIISNYLVKNNFKWLKSLRVSINTYIGVQDSANISGKNLAKKAINVLKTKLIVIYLHYDIVIIIRNHFNQIYVMLLKIW